MSDSNPATNAGSFSGGTAASSMNAIGLAGPARPVRSERPALRTAQIRFISALVWQINVRSPSCFVASIASRSATSP